MPLVSAPSGGSSASFDVLLQFTMDEAANKRVQERVSTIEEELRKIETDAKKAGKAIGEMGTATASKADAAQKSVSRLGAEMAKLGERTKAGTQQANQALDTTIRKYRQLIEVADQVRQLSAGISRAAQRASVGFRGGLVAGTLVTGGIIAEANRYAKEEEAAGRATAATREWTKATEDLARARARVDNVLLREAIPLLQLAARLATQAAGIVEKHPEIVRAALNTGIIVAGISAIGLAVTKGIKLVADTTYIAAVATELIAAKLHNTAADKELAAATAKTITNRADDLRTALNVGKTGGLAGASISGLGLASIAAAGVAISFPIASILENVNKQVEDFGKRMNVNSSIIKVAVLGLSTVEQFIFPLPTAIKKARESLANDVPLIVKLFQRLTGATGTTAAAGGGSRGGRGTGRTDARGRAFADPETEKAVVKAYTDYKADDLALVQEHYRERQGIVQDALAAELDSNKQYAASVSKINAGTTKSLTSAAADFEKANARAEQQYQDSRAQVIRDGNQEIERIEADSKERLRKLTQDHEDRVADLVAHTNALGLAKENRNFGRDVSDEKRQTNQEIRDRRQAIAQRLNDLQQSYEQERAQRQADYQERVAEIRTNAAEQLKELAIQHQEELKRIRDQKIAKLKEMDAQFIEERKRRYAYLVQDIRDLDAGLLGERNLKLQYYDLMLQDAQTWMNKYRAALAAGTSTGTTGGALGNHDYTGYAYPGLYKMADNGRREFVLSGTDTRAAEKIIGSQLNGQNLLQAIAAYGGNRQMNYVDQRRIDQPVSKWDKRLMEEIAVGAMQKLMR